MDLIITLIFMLFSQKSQMLSKFKVEWAEGSIVGGFRVEQVFSYSDLFDPVHVVMEAIYFWNLRILFS